jgi:hypothetical protein
MKITMKIENLIFCIPERKFQFLIFSEIGVQSRSIGEKTGQEWLDQSER